MNNPISNLRDPTEIERTLIAATHHTRGTHNALSQMRSAVAQIERDHRNRNLFLDLLGRAVNSPLPTNFGQPHGAPTAVHLVGRGSDSRHVHVLHQDGHDFDNVPPTERLCELRWVRKGQAGVMSRRAKLDFESMTASWCEPAPEGFPLED